MRQFRSTTKRIEIVGLAMILVGMVCVATTFVVSGSVASGASSLSGEMGCRRPACSLNVLPNTGLASLSPVVVTGSRFKTQVRGAVIECNVTPGEPVIIIPNERPGIVHLGILPVGCTSPTHAPVRASTKGTFTTGIAIETNVIGPPALGTDSAGNSAATDAANYPCPPTQAQVVAGASCAIVFQDSAGEYAYSDISFTIPFTTTTTSSTSTTLITCNPVPETVSSKNQETGTTASLTVDPATCVLGGVTATITATGLVANSSGELAECSDAPGQPTISYNGDNVLVSCSIPLGFTTTAAGGIPTADQNFTIVEGIVGPPAQGTDSSGGSAATDAMNYPCPPTPAQISAGDTCVMAVGDSGGDQVAVPVSFNLGVPPTASRSHR